MATTNLKSLIDRLNNTCRESLQESAGLCLSLTHYSVEIDHWLQKLLDKEDTDISRFFNHYDVQIDRVKNDLLRYSERYKSGNNNPPTISQNVIDLVRESWTLTTLEYNSNEIRSAHLLRVLLENNVLSQLFYSYSSELRKLSLENVIADFDEIKSTSIEETENTSGKTNTSDKASKNTKALDQFTEDLTQQARDGKIDPVLGRESEVRQIIDILTRRRQNNPILTGEAGVGKTAVVEGFALKIAAGDVPPALKNVSLRSLDLGLLQAGAGIKGEFENRLKSVIKEVQSSPNPIILFIDEAHTLIGAGAQSGQGDAANLLKPALARGDLRTVAATTWAEYKKYFEKDPALTRRFQVVKVDEPSEDSAVNMMRGLVQTLENHHKVHILDEAVVDSVHFSKRYITGRQLPDKSVSLLDTACARVAISHSATPAEIEDLTHTITNLKTNIVSLERESNEGSNHTHSIDKLKLEIDEKQELLDTLNEQWNKEKELITEIQKTRESIHELKKSEQNSSNDLEEIQQQYKKLKEKLEIAQGEKPLMSDFVDSHSVTAVVANWTGIPVGKMQRNEIETILNMENLLKKRIIGQTQALTALSKSIETSRAKMTDPKKPIGVFFFVGMSGVGKTETALALAELLYGDESNLITINMSEFKEEHKISLLAGSPPGYVGYGEGGVLTEAVRRKPYSIVLLDEMEKAHPSIQDVFYQVFDKGVMRDGEGRDIDFKNTIIIMTSNACSDLVSHLCADLDNLPDVSELSEQLEPELLKTFKPAFLGRIKVIPYLPLNDENMKLIADLQLKRVQKRITSNYQAEMSYSPNITESIVKRCQEVETGARNIEHILNGTLLPELSREFLSRMASGDNIQSVHVDVNESEEFIYTINGDQEEPSTDIHQKETEEVTS